MAVIAVYSKNDPDKKGDPVSYRVRWKKDDGTWGSKTFRSKKAAQRYDDRIKGAKAGGDELPRNDKLHLDDWGETWQRLHVSTLGRAAQRDYADLWDRWVLAHFKDEEGNDKYHSWGIGYRTLAALERDPLILQEWSAHLATKAGKPTHRKTIAVLSSALSFAVKNNRMSRNPARLLTAPPARRKRKILPLSFAQCELLRRRILAQTRRKSWHSQRDAMLATLIGFEGTRPGEALHLRWYDIGQRVIHVRGGISAGEEGDTKTHLERWPQLFEPVRALLNDWRVATPYSADDDLVIPTDDGQIFDEHDFRNWRSRAFSAARNDYAAGDGLARYTKAVPYDLRHGCASQLIMAWGDAQVAAHLGHTPETLRRTYTHQLEEYRDTKGVDPEQAIADALAQDPQPPASGAR